MTPALSKYGRAVQSNDCKRNMCEPRIAARELQDNATAIEAAERFFLFAQNQRAAVRFQTFSHPTSARATP